MSSGPSEGTSRPVERSSGARNPIAMPRRKDVSRAVRDGGRHRARSAADPRAAEPAHPGSRPSGPPRARALPTVAGGSITVTGLDGTGSTGVDGATAGLSSRIKSLEVIGRARTSQRWVSTSGFRWVEWQESFSLLTGPERFGARAINSLYGHQADEHENDDVDDGSLERVFLGGCRWCLGVEQPSGPSRRFTA